MNISAKNKKKFENYHFTPIKICDYIKLNKHRFQPNLSKKEFKNIFDQLLLENFGPIQTEFVIKNNIIIKNYSFHQLKIQTDLKYNINERRIMYDILEFSETVYTNYYNKYLGGFYGIHNKKQV